MELYIKKKYGDYKDGSQLSSSVCEYSNFSSSDTYTGADRPGIYACLYYTAVKMVVYVAHLLIAICTILIGIWIGCSSLVSA